MTGSREEQKSSSDLPEVVRLFPLPNHVLLPDLPATYRVFEPRYVQLVSDLLELSPEKRWIAIPKLASGYESTYEGSPEFHSIATMGLVEEIEAEEDERYRIVVRGTDRVKLVEIPSERLYRVAEVEPLIDDSVPSTKQATTRYSTILQLIASLSRYVDSDLNELLSVIEASPNLDSSTNRLGAIFLPNAEWKQRFLESRRLDIRLAILEDVLAATLALALETNKEDALPS